MHLFLALGLLIVCGIVDATFYNPRSQTFNQLMERRQRSILNPYSYGYHYNPIEPSMNGLDSLSEGLNSRINTFKPMYQNVKMSTHDVNLVPKTHSYQPKNSVYDLEYIPVAQDIPNLFPEEDSYDYKYLGSPIYKYLTRPSTQESGIAINLVAIKKTSVLGYEFPTYKSPYLSDSMWNFGSKISNTVFEDPRSVESDLDTFRISSPTVKLLPETSEQESIITTTKNSVEDELNYETTQKTPTEAELYPITSKEFQTKDESSFITTEETLTEDKSNPITSEEFQTKDESSFITTEETLTEDKSNPITSEEFQTEDESNSLVLKENPTKDESSFITTEKTLTEDKSNSITTEDKSNSITAEENQKEDDESMSTTSQETTTAFKLNYDSFDTYLLTRESFMSQLKDRINKIREQSKSRLSTVDNIPAKSQSIFESDESTHQELEPQLDNGGYNMYDEY